MEAMNSMKRKIGSGVLCGMLWMSGVSCAWSLGAEDVIRALNLAPMTDEACPGYYRETYRSEIKAALDRDRQAASLIYYLMTDAEPEDPWHRISSDEIMLYHAGAPMRIVLLYPDGSWGQFTLGSSFAEGHEAHVLIPAGTWMGFALDCGAEVDWGLYGVLVVPGWHIDDIEFVTGADVVPLREGYPGAFEVIDGEDWPVLQGRE